MSLLYDKFDDKDDVIIPDGVTIIGHDAFSICSHLIDEITPNSVTSIDENALEYCDKNKSVCMVKIDDFEKVTHCKDCLYYDCNVKFPVCDFHEINADESNYCSWAKRKDDEY